MSYKVSFKTSEQSFISPNLKSNIKYYNLDLSKAGSMVNIPIENLVLTYQNVSTSALRIGIQALSTSVPVLADIRRASIYNSGAVEAQSNNNATITTRLVWMTLFTAILRKPIGCVSVSVIQTASSGLCVRSEPLLPKEGRERRFV